MEMEIKANKKNNSMVVIYNGEKREIKIRNLAPDHHSFSRFAMVDINTNKVLASLSGGGSYGWIVKATNEDERWLLLKVAREAQKASLYWPWTNVQC